jgi:hypothetical protein
MPQLFKKLFKTFNFLLIIIYIFYSPLLNSQENQQQKSSTDIQAVQTRIYKQNYKDVFRTVVSVLQDNKFKVTFTDINTGVVTASGTPQAKENISQAAAAVVDLFLGGLASLGRSEEEDNWTISSNIEELSKNRGTLVRLVIVNEKKTSSFFTTAEEKNKSDDLTTTKPEIYQNIFAKIDKALFIRESIRFKINYI